MSLDTFETEAIFGLLACTWEERGLLSEGAFVEGGFSHPPAAFTGRLVRKRKMLFGTSKICFYRFFSAHILIHEADPQSRQVVITLFARGLPCPYFKILQNNTNFK